MGTRQNSQPSFFQDNLQEKNLLMSRCESARKDLKSELKFFSEHETNMKRFFNFANR